MQPAAEPTTIRRLSRTAHAIFAMLAGMQLDLFTPLTDGPMTAAQLAAALDVDPAKLGLLLYQLVNTGLLAVENGRFANTEEADQFLVRGKPAYMGGAHAAWSEFWAAELKTAASIRTGRAQGKHDYARMTEEELAAILRGFHTGTSGNGWELAQRYDFAPVQSVIDVGGGSGGMGIALAQAYPHLRVTVADLPNVVPITRRFIREAGLEDRVEAIAADVVHEPPTGTYAAAVMRAFLQVLSPDEARAALRNVGEAVRPGGKIYIVGNILDDSRLAPTHSVAMNMVFLNFYDGGQAYTESEHRAWLAEAGFVHFRNEAAMADGTGVCIAERGTPT